MKIFAGLFIMLGLLTGCINNESDSIEGKIMHVNLEEKSFTLFVGDTLSDEERVRMDFGDDDAAFEAYTIKIDNKTKFEGEEDSFYKIKLGQKVSIDIMGTYEKKLVNFETFSDNVEDLPVYEAENVTVVPYEKQDIVEEMVANIEEGTYGFFAFYHNSAERDGNFPDFIDTLLFQRMAISTINPNDVRNIKELLGLYEDSPTYIITNHKEIVLKTNDMNEIKEFVKTLETNH